MRAVTVVSPEFEALGHEAAIRFWRYTGIEVDVLRCAAADGHRVKLEALRDAAKHGWRFFFDADWWLIRPCHEEIRALLGPWLAGSPIPGDMADSDAREYGYDPRCRITSGFLTFDPMLPQWDKVIRLALELQDAVSRKCDEVYLNAAAHHLGLPVRVIDSGWNWYMRNKYPYEPSQIWALHAGGYPVTSRFQLLQAAATNSTTPSWSLDASELVWLQSLARKLCQQGLRRVVEFGPGASTSALLAAGSRVTTCETSARAYCMHAAHFQKHQNLTICLTHHEPQLSGLSALADWCFVDGPVGSLLVEGKSRWHQLCWSAARCNFILLHDSKRTGEQCSIAALKAAGWKVIDIESPRGFAILWRGCDDLITKLHLHDVKQRQVPVV